MAPLVVLVVTTLLARCAGWAGVGFVGSWVASVALGLAVMFLVTGASHFAPRRRAGLVAIVPRMLPWPGLLVTLTGVLEVLGAAALLVPGRCRVTAAGGLAVLLVVMFPANVRAAGARRSPTSPTTPLLPRTAMQVVFVAAAVLVALA